MYLHIPLEYFYASSLHVSTTKGHLRREEGGQLNITDKCTKLDRHHEQETLHQAFRHQAIQKLSLCNTQNSLVLSYKTNQFHP